MNLTPMVARKVPPHTAEIAGTVRQRAVDSWFGVFEIGKFENNTGSLAFRERP